MVESQDRKANSHREHVSSVDETIARPQDDEENMSWREALKVYRPAVYWALAMSIQNIMEGYNISLVASLVVFPSFAQRYGRWYPDLGWQVTVAWQMAFSLGAAAGGIVGGLIGGWALEYFGPRRVVMVSQVLLTGTIFITFYAVNVQMLFAGMLANGIPWGALASVGSIYSSEVCPTVLRGYIINFSNVTWLFGTLVCAIILKPLVNNPSEWSYRIPFAIQWVWPVPLFMIAYFAPDSPWWLLRRDNHAGAVKAVKRLSTGLSDEQVEAKLVALKRTNELEKCLQTESRYKDCFRGTNLLRTEIACMVMMAQAVTGAVLAATPTYFMLQVGLSPQNALIVNIVGNVFGIIGNIVCWILMHYYGRRPLFIIGLAALAATLLLIGILDVSHSPSTLWAQSAFCIIWIGVFGAFVAPESYTIAGEVSATRVRAQTISLSKTFYGIMGVISGVIQVYTVNPTGADIRGKSAYVWFGCTFLLLLWAIFRLPETKGRTYEELDVLFGSNTKPRVFKGRNVDVNAEQLMDRDRDRDRDQATTRSALIFEQPEFEEETDLRK